MTTTYVHAFTEYEVEANKRDHAKHAQGCNECSQTEYEVNPYDQQSETYSHIFTAAPGAPAAKIERRAALDAETTRLEAEIATAKTKHADTIAAKDAETTRLEAEIATAKTKHADTIAAKDAEITALMVEIAAAKTKRNITLAVMDAEIAVLEAEIAARR